MAENKFFKVNLSMCQTERMIINCSWTDSQNKCVILGLKDSRRKDLPPERHNCKTCVCALPPFKAHCWKNDMFVFSQMCITAKLWCYVYISLYSETHGKAKGRRLAPATCSSCSVTRSHCSHWTKIVFCAWTREGFNITVTLNCRQST